MPYQSIRPGAKRNVNVQIDPELCELAKELNVSLSWILEEAIKELAKVRTESDVLWLEVSNMRKRVKESYKKRLAEIESQQKQRLMAEIELQQKESDKEDLLNIVIYQCIPENTMDISYRGDMSTLSIFKSAIELNQYDKTLLDKHRALMRKKLNLQNISDGELNMLIKEAYPSWEVAINAKWGQKGRKRNKNTT